ncbi:MAG: AAA family ATPase [Gemmatimonadales bacterium]
MSRTRQDVPPHPSPLDLRVLGADAALSRRGIEADILLGPGKPLSLLAYLACSPRRTTSREHLVDLLWSDLEPDRARHALRQTVWYLRQLLGTEGLVTRGDTLELTTTLVLDRDQFLAAVEDGELARAAALYRGDFLAEFAAPGGVEFEHWADVERQRLRSIFLRVAETLVRQWLNEGNLRDANHLARRARDADPASESSWRLLFETLIQSGDRLALTLEVDQFEERLASLGRTPDPATRTLLARAQVAVRLAAPGVEAPGLAAELVGREREFGAIVAAWQAPGLAARHLHIVAPAGLGKTRLLGDVAVRLRTLGARVVSLRANPGQREIGYSFVAALAEQLALLPGAATISPGSAGTLVALCPALSSRFSQPADPSTGEEALRRRAAAIAELLRMLAEEQRVALLLDDLHWLDTSSRRVFGSLLVQLNAPGLLIVSAARPVAGADLGMERTEYLSLPPLTVEQVRILITSIGRLPEEPWAPTLAPALTRATAGSPLLLLETLQLAMDRGWLRLADGTWQCGSPEALARGLEGGSALRHRIEQLDAESRRVLLLLAVAGTPLPSEVILQSAGLPEDSLAAVLGVLEQRGFVQCAGHEWRPAHDEIAADALACATPEATRPLHEALGLALAADPAAPRQQLVLAGRHLRSAGRHAARSGVLVRYLALARRLGDGRRVGEIAYEFLGEDTLADEVIRTVRQIPPWTRLHYSSARRAVGAAALVLVLLLGVAALISWSRRPDGILVLRDLNKRADDREFDLALRRADWDPDEPIDATGLTPHPMPVQVDGIDGFIPGAMPGTYFFTRNSDPASLQDIYYVDQHGDTSLVFRSPTDDVGPSPTPDGRSLVFTTGAFSPSNDTGYISSEYNYDVAVIDLQTRVVTRLTSSSAAESDAYVSPDGTRVAFMRSLDGREEICWIPLRAGAEPRCRGDSPDARPSVLGWRDDGTLLVVAPQGGASALFEYDLETGQMTRRLSNIIATSLSPDRKWLAFTAAWDGVTREELYVVPVDAPGEWRRVISSNQDVADLRPFWRRLWPPRAHLSSIKINNLGPSLRLESSYELSVLARSAAAPEGTPVASVEWSVSDSTVGAITPDGRLQPRGAGSAWVIARAGPLADSVWVRVAPGVHQVVYREDWSRGIAPGWITFGTPRPVLRAGPDGSPAFLGNGDGSFQSGAYSRRSWNAINGLGIEALAYTKVTGDKWQSIVLELLFGLDSTALGAWNHSDGNMPFRHGREHRFTCGVGYPAREGAGRDTTLSASGGGSVGPLTVPRVLGTGRWFRLRVQVFPDGGCGVAVDGLPMWRSRLTVHNEGPMAVRISGAADGGAAMLLGPLEIWQGVRNDVEWSRLDDAEYDPRLALARALR